MGLLSRLFKKNSSDENVECVEILGDNTVFDKDIFELNTRPYKMGGIINTIYFPKNLKGLTFARKYNQHRICIISNQKPDFNKIKLFENIKLVSEPDNPYDSNAVAIWAQTQKLGYLYRNGFQDIINKHLSEGNTVVGSIISIDSEDIDIDVAVYK